MVSNNVALLPTEPLLDRGTGFPILLLPGNELAFSSWNTVIDSLAQTHRVLLPRLPFHESPLTNERRKDLVAYLKRFVFYNLLNRVIVISSGTGADAAMHFAKKCSDKIYKLIVTSHLTTESDSHLTQMLPASIEDKNIKTLFFKNLSNTYPSLLLLRDHCFRCVIPHEFWYSQYRSSMANTPQDFLEKINEFLQPNNTQF